MLYPKFALLSFIVKKPVVLTIVAPITILTHQIVSFEGMAWVLFYTFLFDLATGLCASYFTWKENSPKERWFFGNGEGFSSEKAKKCFLKGFVYLVIPYILIQLQRSLFLKNFKYSRISDAEFEWATTSLIFFFLVEFFSIFNENLPKCGINVWKILKKMLGLYREVKEEIKK